MSEVPPQAVQAASEAISRMLFSGQPECGTWMEHDDDLARAAVEAAAPAIAEQAATEGRRKIAGEIRQLGDWPDGYGAFRAFMARHGLDRHGETPVFSGLLLALADEVEGVALHEAKTAEACTYRAGEPEE